MSYLLVEKKNATMFAKFCVDDEWPRKVTKVLILSELECRCGKSDPRCSKKHCYRQDSDSEDVL